MKILGISGSPRKNGNTEQMINLISNNNDFEMIRLYEKSIKPCIACDGCSKTGKCIIKDDMLEITKKIEESDVLIMGSPVYWWSVSAGFKTFMDRWYSKEVRTIIGKKKIILTLPMGDTEDETAKWAVGSLKDSLEYIGANIVEIVVGKGLNSKNDINNHPDLIKKLKSIL